MVSLLLPLTRPVDYMNYSSICSKQLGNYYYHNQINISLCDVETPEWNFFVITFNRTKKRSLGKISGFLRSISVVFFVVVFLFYYSFSSGAVLSLSAPTFSLVQPSSFLSLSHVPPKDIHEKSCEVSGGLPRDHSLLVCVSLSFAALTF